MRISQNMFKLQSTRNLSKVEEQLIDVQKKLSNGIEVSKPSDDPLRYVTAAKFKSSVKIRTQYLRNSADARRFAENNENATNKVIEVLQRARSLFIQGANETLTTHDTQQIAKELRQMLDNVIQLSNSEGTNGKFFGGTDTESDPFDVIKDSNGNVTEVRYKGDRTAVQRTISEDATIDVNFIGSQFFQIDPQIVNSSFTASFAGQSLTAAGFPAGETTGHFNIQEKRVFFDTANDSLIDISTRINDKSRGINATVNGTLTGTATVASATAASAATAGTITINSQTIAIAAGASLNDVITAVNGVSAQTGVTASSAAVTGGFALQLDGGVEITDTGTGRSNALTLLGATNGTASPTNLTSRNALSYSLRVQPDIGDQIFAEDEGSGRFLQRMGMTDGTFNTPNNIPAAQTTNTTIFTMLINAITNLEAGDTVPIQNARIQEIDGALNNVGNIRSNIGAQIRRIELTEDREREFVLQAQTVIRDNEDLDIALAISDLQRLQQKLQTAIAASRDLPSNNLLAFL
ncbi:MAG: flagellar hook-associated protein FlgL [Candidatus Lindowbacteria bacterium]|nr:flagellar hook-associated protein FlgL [Candidatus Lindowbacteria bacterium]